MVDLKLLTNMYHSVNLGEERISKGCTLKIRNVGDLSKSISHIPEKHTNYEDDIVILNNISFVVRGSLGNFK